MADPVAPAWPAPSVADAARAYAERGWSPVPIPYKEKGPRGKDWGRPIDPAQLAQHFNGGPQNIGIILGAASGGLTDVDLDCSETVALAPYVLPRTGAIFGRESKPSSHWLYLTGLAQARPKAIDRYEDVGGKTLVELRMGGGGKAAQTVFPPSTHPSGEPVRWDANGDPAGVDGDDLDRRVRLLAATALMARHWPLSGDQSDTWGAIGRRFADAEASSTEIGPLVEGFAKLVDADWRAAKDTAVNVAESFDGSSVKELFGAVVAERLDRFLGAGEVIEDEAETTFDRPAGRRELMWAQAEGCAGEIAKTMNAETIAQALGGRKAGGGWTALCPAHDDHKPSLSIKDANNGKVLVHCHAGCDQESVIAELRAQGLWPETGPRRLWRPKPRIQTEAQPASDDARREAALRIWRATEPAEGTLVETYLATRGLLVPIPGTIRFHAALKHASGDLWPAMVAVVTRGSDDAPVGIHRTFLARDGSGKAPVTPNKMMLGPCSGGAVRLASARDVLMVGEGIETVLSAMQATGHPAWAALSTSGLRNLDLPRGVRDVIVLADGDDPGEAAAQECARRWRREGRHVRIARPPRQMDFNDLLVRGAPGDGGHAS